MYVAVYVVGVVFIIEKKLTEKHANSRYPATRRQLFRHKSFIYNDLLRVAERVVCG